MDEQISSPVELIASLEKKLAALETQNARLVDENTMLHQLYERAPLSYQSLDEHGCFLVVNQAWLDTLGYSREEVVGQNFGNFLHPDWQDHFKENFPRFKAVGEILGVEFQMRKKDGSFVLVSFNGKIGKDPLGNFQQTYCLFQDITERKKAEEALRQSESLFRTLVNTIPDLIWLKNADGVYLSCNKRVERFFGARETEIRGKTDYDFVDEELADFFREHDRKAMAAGGPSKNEEQITFADDGRTVFLETIKTPMFDTDGNLIGVLGIGRDITERKQAEEEYLKFFTISEKALFGSAIADLEGNLVYVNDYFAQIHGYTVKELVGRKIDIFHSDEQMPLVRKTIEDALKKGNIDAIEIPHLHKNRREFPMLMSLTVINDSLGKLKYIAASAFDLTEQKSAQQKIQNTVNDQNVMLDNDPTLIYFKDCYNNIIRVTESVAKATSLTREEIEGRPSKEVYPDMADKYWEDDLEVIKSGKPKHNIVEPLTGVDGSSHWLLTTKVPVKNDSGEIVGICVFATDITDLKNAELGLIAAKEKAEESEERFLLAMKASHDGLFDWNLETNDIYYSPAWKNMLGYEDHELPNDFSVWANIINPEDVKKSWALQQQLVTKQIDRFVNEFKMKHKDGHWVDILSRAKAIFNESGKAVRIIGTHTDITERKQAEEALKDASVRVSLATKAGGVGVWEYDLVHNRLQWDEQMYGLYGIRRDAFGGAYESWRAGVHPEDVARCDQEVAMALSGEKEFGAEFRVVWPDGTVRHIQALAMVLRDADGKPLRMIGTNWDITERKQAEGALKEANVVLAQKDALLRSMLQNLPFDFWARDLHQNMLIQSRESIRMWGGLTGTAFHESDFTPEYLEEWKAANARVLTGEVVTSEQAYIVCGEQRQFYAIVAPILQADEVQGILGINIDITELKRTEIALREKEYELNDILDNAISQIWAFDGQHYTYFNKAYYDFTGLEPRERLSIESWTKFIHPDDLEMAGTVWSKAWKTKKEHDNFFRLRNKTGEYRDFWCHAVPIFHDDRFSHFQGYNLDITEQKRAEESLRESEERFKALHNASFGGIAIHDKGVILECNQGLAEISGFSYEELIGMDGLLLISEKTRGIVLKNIQAGYEKPYEAIGLRKNGDEFPVRLESRNIPYKGKSVRVVEFRDITEQKQQEAEREKLQTQLEQAQKMESVGRLAGGVAHDFNNMLGVILGYTELAMERVEPDTPLHADLEKIQGAAQRSADLTRQLLAFARKQTVAPKVIDLNDTIEGILKLLRRLIGEDIDLAWRPVKDVWPVKIDPTQIDQILANLCVNARDAIVDTGKVTIETGIASFDEEYCSHHADFVPGDYVLLAVSDTGCGMDKETQALLFEPFFTTKEVGKGTGLGLATVYGVVKQNNGFIDIYSEPGKGTTFKIYLPRHLDKTVPLPEKELDKPSERGHQTVLLVEDESMILEMTTIMLESLGYTVLAAGTPGEAIRLAQEHPGRIDLLLTDVIMPEMNGRDLAKSLLSIYPDIRRLFMSGYTADVIAHHGVLEEGMHFIQKPFIRHDLAAKIREALEV